MQTLKELLSEEWFNRLIASGALLVILLLMRMLLLQLIRRSGVEAPDIRRRWRVQVRNSFATLMFFGLTLIWVDSLQSMALSLAAFVVALVLATKELILCVTGGILRMSSKSFTVGDRIEVANLRGDVINLSLMTTTIMETGPGQLTHQYTGRAVVFPNSMLLSTPVVNESFTDDFVLHVFRVPMKQSADWRSAEEDMLAAAGAVCEPFIEDAKRYMTQLAERESLDVPSAEPRVTFVLPEPDRVDLIVRIPTPARQKGQVEQRLLRTFLNLQSSRKHKADNADEKTD